MITETVRELKKTMNAPTEPQEETGVRGNLRAANQSWLRYPMLVVTVLLLAVVTIKARQLTEGILAAVEPVEELLNLPF